MEQGAHQGNLGWARGALDVGYFALIKAAGRLYAPRSELGSLETRKLSPLHQLACCTYVFSYHLRSVRLALGSNSKCHEKF